MTKFFMLTYWWTWLSVGWQAHKRDPKTSSVCARTIKTSYEVRLLFCCTAYIMNWDDCMLMSIRRNISSLVTFLSKLLSVIFSLAHSTSSSLLFFWWDMFMLLCCSHESRRAQEYESKTIDTNYRTRIGITTRSVCFGGVLATHPSCLDC